MKIMNGHSGGHGTITVDELMEEQGFEAVFIGSGAGLPMFMDIPGVNLQGRPLRQRVPHPYQPDEGLSAGLPTPPSFTPGRWRSWAEETWLWTRPAAPSAWGLRSTWFTAAVMEELPARKEEVEHAEEEGIIFKPLLTIPVRNSGR